MRIALCLEYPIALRGGVSVLVETMAEKFIQNGHNIVLVSADTKETFKQSAISRQVETHFTWNPQNSSTTAAKMLVQQLTEAGVQLAHFHLGGNYGWGNRFPFCCPVYYLDRAGIPCVTSVHLVVSLLDGYCGPHKPAWFKALMLPLAWMGKMHQLRHTRREIAVSRHDFIKLRRWYRPLQNRFTQIYHSRLPETPVQPDTTERKPVILNVGHLAWRKGQLVLAKAFARIASRHPDWILQLAGDDVDRATTNQILQIASDAKITDRIQLLGERHDATELMRHAAIYVQPSYWEALGLALQEAMYYGGACIGSRAGGIPELIQDGQTGLLVDPGNVLQLADTLERMICHRELRTQLGTAAAISIRERNMTVEGMARRHLELYAQIVEKS